MAYFSNRFSIFAYGDVVRIMFEDCIKGQEGVIQTQVVMRTADAEALGKKILELIEQQRGQNTGR